MKKISPLLLKKPQQTQNKKIKPHNGYFKKLTRIFESLLHNGTSRISFVTEFSSFLPTFMLAAIEKNRWHVLFNLNA